MAAFSVTQEVAESVRDAALSVDGVAGVSGGRMGQAFLRVSGAMIEGIQLIDASVPHLALHLTYDLSSRRQIPSIVADVRTTVASLPAFTETDTTPRIDVVFDDAS